MKKYLLIFMLLLMAAGTASAQTDSSEADRAGLPERSSELLSAAEAPAAPAPPSPGDAPLIMPDSPAPRYGMDILRAAGMFVLVLGLLFLTLKVIGRFGRFRARGKQGLFNMRGIMPLDNRKYLAAVEIEGRLLVVGVTQERICPVAHWPLPDQAEPFAFGLNDDDDLPDIGLDHNSGELK